MPTLRLTQHREQTGKFRVDIELTGEGLPRQTVTTPPFDFQLTAQDHEDIRWYLEDFLQYPHDPAPAIAEGIEKHMAGIGCRLFEALFHPQDARDLWATLRTRLDDTHIEVVTSVAEATSIPWELVRDPKTDVPLALRARAFVRAQPQAAQTPYIPLAESGPIRILLVICRPGGREDVPFRSVAGRLIKGLGEDARRLFQLDLLRPPTFEQLAKSLRAAKAGGAPYHVVHFDGHGMYAEVAHASAAAHALKKLMPLLLHGPMEGPHGYILFENPAADENLQLVDGASLANLLVETKVPVLVLNACRSAHADIRTAPATAHSPGGDPAARDEFEEPHQKVRAFGSFAQEVMDAGVAGVVAMRYNVYVVTAAQFVADLYASLTQGQSLGEAATLGRKQLNANPLREIAFDPRPLQDWSVPIVYEAAPIALFPKSAQEPGKLTIALGGAGSAAAGFDERAMDPSLPRRPDVGFFGRDETLLALDRAFDTQPVVLLHGFAGCGKTATAAEFARWYALTGGLKSGRVLFSSFEHHAPLRTVLGHFGSVFGPTLDQAGINWSAITETGELRRVALEVLQQIPVLWIWDNVEPVTGFPRGTDSSWSKDEQKELVDFLRDARETKARFLLTSRRDERDWLGDLPRRIPIPPMPMQERVLMARALAEKYGRRLTAVDDWRPLLEYTQGNPLTITVVVGEAFRQGLKAKEEIEDFVAKLRMGEAAFPDEASEGRSGSLGASLNYGFENAFDDGERKQLALLHLFQGFVDVDVLGFMGNPERVYCLPEVRGLTREAGIALLDRAAEIGLLTAIGGGCYTIHPAVPWFLKSLFDRYYPSFSVPQSATAQAAIRNPRLEAMRAYVEAMGGRGDYYFHEYGRGNRDAVHAMMAEEANLLHARRLARENGWWGPVTGAMQGVRYLYEQTGRRAEWKRLVEEIVPDFVDPATDGPTAGQDDRWSLVTEYRVLLATEARQWPEAERLQHIHVDWDRSRAAPPLSKNPEELDDNERNVVRTLAVSLEQLAHIRREQGQKTCVAGYEEALGLYERIGDRSATAGCAINLGHAYKDLRDIRNLDKAEEWYRRSLELCDERDLMGKAHCWGQLGSVAYARFIGARAANEPEEVFLRLLNEAAAGYHKALEMLPKNAIDDLAVTHHALGVIYAAAGDLDRARFHYQESIRYCEGEGDLYGAGQTRYNVARMLARAGRFQDALQYAEAALRNFEMYGAGAAADIEKTRRLIAQIKNDLRGQGAQ